jgi:hypothetical protein
LVLLTAIAGCLMLLYFFVFREGVLPVIPEWWPGPTDGEIDEANANRYYPPNEDEVLTLNVESIGLTSIPAVRCLSQYPRKPRVRSGRRRSEGPVVNPRGPGEEEDQVVVKSPLPYSTIRTINPAGPLTSLPPQN